MSGRRYPIQYETGEDGWCNWIQPKEPEEGGYRMMCCDCRLIHDMEFRVDNGRIQYRARRNNRATAAGRRKRIREETV
jgi:hypothetical protein